MHDEIGEGSELPSMEVTESDLFFEDVLVSMTKMAQELNDKLEYNDTNEVEDDKMKMYLDIVQEFEILARKSGTTVLHYFKFFCTT